MTMPDTPPVTTPHSTQIIGSNWPTTSETGTVASVIALYEQAAASVGTGNTAEVMFALIEANATGQTPTELLGEFTQDQQAAFDRALRQLNMGQGASVMAQDIMNTKVALNGTVTSFEAAVEQLIASYAGSGGPGAPQNQAEFQEQYNQLLQQAIDQANTLGQNHTSTQDQLVSGVQQGAAPEIPSTMAPTSSSSPTVPGMPDDALGSMLQNVAGQMMKPENLPMPNLGQVAQPLAQSAQQAIQELMSNSGSGSGVPITDDALARLTSAAGLTNQGTTLSAASSGNNSDESENGSTSPGSRLASLSGSSSDNSTGRLPGATSTEAEGETEELSPYPTGEATPLGASTSEASMPTEAATTNAPTLSSVGTTLSSGGGGVGEDTLSSAPQTRVSSGDAAPSSAALGQPAATGAGPGVGGAPMMGPMMGGAGAGAPMGGTAAVGSSSGSAPSDASKRPGFRPDLTVPENELVDFGSARRGLDHATDVQHMAASMSAALVRWHERSGKSIKVAVGLSGSQAVFATSDGISFLAPGVRAPAHLTPLITAVPDSFVDRWLGCDQPWRPLLAAAELGSIAPLDSVVSTDASAGQEGVLVLSAADVAEVNVAPSTQQRHQFDAVELQDVDAVFTYLCGVWGQPTAAPVDLEAQSGRLRWTGEGLGRDRYARAWARYLLAAALVDLQSGDIDDARYVLRNALRIPVRAEATLR